ncbi:MAG: hypothetical protein NPMRTH1_400015 [Nitrosopumilales archaeon]|nr:MAG: hypothetical protein NPMRTH1_400015 [Nitrosopumilales archaeon]
MNYTWDRMKDDPKFQIKLNKHEKKLYDVVPEHSGLNLLQILEKTKMNKNTTKKYLDRLCEYDLIEVVELKQGEKAYFKRLKGTKSFSQSYLEIKKDFEIRKSIIRDSLKSLNNDTPNEIIFVYSKCIQLLFSFDNGVKFTISSNKHKKLKKQWLELEKENQELLDEVTTGINNKLFYVILQDILKSDNDNLDQLEYYNKTKQKKSLK